MALLKTLLAFAAPLFVVSEPHGAAASFQTQGSTSLPTVLSLCGDCPQGLGSSKGSSNPQGAPAEPSPKIAVIFGEAPVWFRAKAFLSSFPHWDGIKHFWWASDQSHFTEESSYGEKRHKGQGLGQDSAWAACVGPGFWSPPCWGCPLFQGQELPVSSPFLLLHLF